MTDQSPLPRIGLLGLGALGTLMAWHWRQLPLSALPRQPQPAVSLRLQAQDGAQHRWQLPCWHGETLDWLVVTTKAAATLHALAAWRSDLPAVSRILLLQNGMGQQQACADWLQAENLRCELWAGVSTAGAYRRQTEDNDLPLTVHAGSGTTLIGRWDNTDNSAPPALPAELTFCAGIHQPMRAKLAVNAVINPLTGLLRCSNGELLTNPAYRQQMLALAAEIAGLYQALAWPLNVPLPQQVCTVAEATAANRSSTLQDILAGRPTELPYICGYLLHCAQQAGISLPLTAGIYHQLQTADPA